MTGDQGTANCFMSNYTRLKCNFEQQEINVCFLASYTVENIRLMYSWAIRQWLSTPSHPRTSHTLTPHTLTHPHTPHTLTPHTHPHTSHTLTGVLRWLYSSGSAFILAQPRHCEWAWWSVEEGWVLKDLWWSCVSTASTQEETLHQVSYSHVIH